MINSHNNIKPDPPLLNPTIIIAADSENPTKSKRIIQLTGGNYKHLMIRKRSMNNGHILPFEKFNSM